MTEEQRKYHRDYYHNKRDKQIKIHNQKLRLDNLRLFLLNYLKDKSCIDCGEQDPVVLDFDHLRDKEKNVTDALRHGWSKERLIKEIKKCVIRCANCHRRKTAKERNYYRDVAQPGRVNGLEP